MSKKPERNFINRPRWNDRELLDLATGMQKYGTSDTGKIAELIGTKTAYQVKCYMRRKMKTLRKKVIEERKKSKEGNEPLCLLSEEMKSWPPVCKWNQIARNQNQAMYDSHLTKNVDYSAPMMRNMFEDFYEEAEEATNQQVVDVKAIYKFLLDCVSGKNPAELMPKESGVVLMLLKKLREVKSAFDFDEEKNFIHSFQKATHFVPNKEKDKDANKEKHKASEEDPDAVRIPEEVYNLLDHHSKIVHSMNPLMVPLWLLEKEQNYLFQAMQSTTEMQ